MSDREPAAPAPAPADGRADAPDEPPPFLGHWGVLYALVLSELVLMIALCYGLSRWGH